MTSSSEPTRQSSPRPQTTPYLAAAQPDRSATTAHTYKFHTSLLRVDKTIGRETADLLYNKNPFILVTVDDINAAAVLHASDVPIACEGRVGGDESASMLWRSVRMCARLRVRGFLLKSGARDGDGEVVEPPRVKIERVAGTPVSVKTEKMFLEALREAVGAGYEMTIHGFSDEVAVTKVLEHIYPKLVWHSLYALERIDLLLDLKKGADTLARAECFPAAISRYTDLLDTACGRPTESTYTHPLRPRIDYSTPISSLQLTRIDILVRDIALGLLWIYLRLGRVDLADQMTVYAITASPSLRTTRTKNELVHALLVIRAMRAAEKEVDADGDLPAVRHWMDTVSQNSKEEITSHLARDTEVMKKALDRLDQGGRFELRIEDLSVSKEPTKIFNSDVGDFVDVPVRSVEDTGLQDFEHLRRFTIEEKEEIVGYQRENGLFVSDFS